MYTSRSGYQYAVSHLVGQCNNFIRKKNNKKKLIIIKGKKKKKMIIIIIKRKKRKKTTGQKLKIDDAPKFCLV